MLIVDDVDEFVARAEANGVEVSSRPWDGPFGRMASVKDLYGDAITLASPSAWETMRR